MIFFSFKGISNTKLDSLLNELYSNENEVKKIHTLNGLGDLLKNRSSDSSELYYQQGLQLSNHLLLYNSDNEVLLEKANILSGLGYINYLDQDFKDAILKLEESLKIKESLSKYLTLDQTSLLLHLSFCYFSLNDHQSSIEYLLDALKENEKGNDVGIKTRIYYSLAENYYSLEIFHKAKESYKMSYKLACENNFENVKVITLNSLTALYQKEKNWKKSDEYLLKSLRVIKANNDFRIIDYYAVKGYSEIHKGFLDSASFYLNLGEELGDKNNVSYSLVKVYKYRSILENKIKNYDLAYEYALKVEDYGVFHKDINVIIIGLELKYEIYESRKDYKNALLSLKKLTELKKKHITFNIRGQLLKQELILKSEQKELSDSLKFDAVRQNKEAEIKNQIVLLEEERKTKYFLGGSLFLVLIVLIVIIKGLKRRKKDNEIILAQQKESEVHQLLLVDQNKNLQSKASLFKILNVCSKDVSIKNILSEVLDHLVVLNIIGGANEGFVYLETKGRYNGVDVFSGILDEKIKIFKESPHGECVCGKKYKDYKIELCCNGVLKNHYNIPVVNNNEVLGIMVIFTSFSKEEMKKELDFLEIVSKLLGETIYRHNMSDKLRLAHIENTLKKKEVAKIHNQVEEALNKQAAINGLMEAIINNENIGGRVFNYVTDIFGGVYIKRLNITLFDFTKKEVAFYFLRENGEDKLENKPFSLDEFSKETIESLKRNQRIVVTSIKEKEIKSVSDLKMMRNNIDSFVSFPLMSEGKLLGSLNVSFEERISFTQSQEQFLNMLVEGITIAINQNVMFNQIVSNNTELSMLHNELNSSINYAQKIQEAILPSEELFSDIFAKHFVIHKQKNSVGGDFYWVREYKKGVKMVACIDCTGHNVPGAFMTMLARVLIREAAIIKELRNPTKILTQMDGAIRRILKQSSYEGMQDGMDMTVCVIDENKNSIEFSSAHNPIIYLEKGKEKLTVIKGSKFAVGGYFETEKKFDTISLKLDTIEKFYMLSDGYVDQFGGPNVKKIGKNSFINSLNLIQNLPIKKQKEFLLNEFNNWKGDLDQIDDVCVIGVDLT